MSIAPWSDQNGSGNTRWLWGQNYGWCHFEDYHFKSGQKTHVVKLSGGTPWRYPTEYYRDILNIKTVKNIHTLYPDGGQWWGLITGGTSDVFYILDAGGWSPGNIQYPNFDQNLWNGSTTKALEKLANQKADLGSNIAEGRQAISLISKTSSKVFKAMIALKHGNFRQVAEELGMSWRSVLLGKFPANRWLEYQFGWKPLISDIYDGYQNYHEIVNRDLIVTGYGSMHADRNGEFVLGGSQGPWSVKEKAKCRIDAIISIPELRQANQWNLINPLSVAWEVMPWSFAVDWFIPVGNVLEATTASAGLQFLSGSVSQVRETHQTIKFVATGGYTIVEDGEITIEKLQMRRYPIYDFPDPAFYAKTSNPFTSTHSKNALALWRQLPGLR
jgi:hypothetical protein